MTDFQSIVVSKDGNIATVELVGPGKGNAMGPDFWRELPIAFDQLDQDDEIRAVVVRARGNNFTYGLDLMAKKPEGKKLAEKGKIAIQDHGQPFWVRNIKVKSL